ncbi:MAG: hypothetical protein IPQ16_03755 [Geobacteraceae bacterium]|nr:hypothetical protein [Geobacteraceae bacterium]
MKKSRIWNFRSIGGRIMLGLMLAVITASLDAAPALARDHGDRQENRHYENRDRHDNSRYENRGRRYQRNRHRGYRTRTVYRERVYVAPPVVYEPPPPPGISLFFPPIIFR